MKTVRAWLRRKLGREAEWQEEIESHLQMCAEWNRARGLPEPEARQTARTQFGNVLSTLENVRAVHMWG